MTPEERWIKIENAIQALVAAQAHHDAEIAATRQQIGENNKQIAENSKRIAETSKLIEKTSKETGKNTAAIRDLIAISRTLIDTPQARDKEVKELRLNLTALIETVNSFVKSLQKPNGNQ
jgi:chromosome segregation ATPase